MGKKKEDKVEVRMQRLEEHLQKALLIVQSYAQQSNAKNKNFTEKEFIKWLDQTKIILSEN